MAVKLGLLGCGGITETVHLPVLKNLPDINVAAIALGDPVRRGRIARQFRIPHEHSDAAGLLDDKSIDAVGIWGLPGEQVATVTAALSVGKHVFIEKPTFLDLSLCDRLRDHATRCGKTVMFGFPRRWTRAARRAREMILRGELGSVTTVRTVSSSAALEARSHPEWEANHFRVGILFEFGVHHFDLLHFLFGSELGEIHALTGRDQSSATVTARIADNVLASCVFSEKTSGNDEVEIYGDAGRLRISPYRFDGTEYFPAASLPGDAQTRARHLVQTIKELPGGLLRARQGGDFLASYRSMWRHFADCVRRGTQPECTMEDGKKALRAVLAAMDSAHRAESGSGEQRRSMP